jgi:hypothetical protein
MKNFNMKLLLSIACRQLVAVLVLILILNSHIAFAQGDGPRTFLSAPKGLWGINPKATFLNQNFLPSGDILIKDADINVNVVPTTIFHTFSIGGRFAQAMFMINPGSANGRVVADAPGLPAPHVSASGFGDGFVGLKIGLIGAPALNVMEFAKHIPAFSMNGYFRVWYSGTYDSKKPLNLGTHRTTFEVGFPMAIPLSKNIKRATWLEIYPSVRLYTVNNNPTLVTRANKSHQVPLYLLENHLTHNFTTKFWAGVDLRYQYGGALELDDVKQDNKVNILGGSISAGYQALPFLSFSGNYGGILAGDNDARSNMFRVSAVFIYVNTKKLKAQAKPVVLAPVVTDSDGDGISDAEDKCPDMAGISKYGGCPIPDSDGDAINDEEDKCPNVAGILKYGGCPIPDTDGDGINDEEDKCPAIAGLSKYGGCPVSDTDGDGINDETDKCPRLAGTPGNLGCPEMVLLYKKAEAVLSADDKLQLDKVVGFLEANPDLSIIIEGHTSTLGATDYNQKLSERRASNSVKYIVSKGIAPERLKSIGYGEQFPIGDNATEEGRAQSRRTVIRIAQ